MSSWDLIFDKDKPLVTDETVMQNSYCACYICKLRKNGQCDHESATRAMEKIARGEPACCCCTNFLVDENDPEALEYIVAILERQFRYGEGFDTNSYPTAGAIWGAMNYCIKLYKEQNNSDEQIHNILNEIDEISRRVSAGKEPDNE